jgi:hypothetical protein
MDEATAESVGERIVEILGDLRDTALRDEHLVSQKEAAAILAVSPGYLSKLVTTGVLDRYDVARNSAHPVYRFRLSDIRGFIDASAVTPTGRSNGTARQRTPRSVPATQPTGGDRY